MRILKLLSRFIICILCISCLCNVSIAASNLPTGDVGEYGNFLTHDNISVFNENLAKDFQNKVRDSIKFIEEMEASSTVSEDNKVEEENTDDGDGKYE